MSEVGKPAARTALIVITYNSRKFFARLAASIAVQTDQNFQLVVWDNGSRKTERPLAADFLDGAVIVQCEENIGFASANNRAAELVESEFIVLLNPDAFPEADWLATLVETANHWPDTGGVGSTQIMDEDPTRYDGLGDCYYAVGIAWRGGYGWPRRSLVNDGTEAFSACAAAALYRRMAWDAVGGFDERFFAYCEDVDSRLSTPACGLAYSAGSSRRCSPCGRRHKRKTVRLCNLLRHAQSAMDICEMHADRTSMVVVAGPCSNDLRVSRNIAISRNWTCDMARSRCRDCRDYAGAPCPT